MIVLDASALLDVVLDQPAKPDALEHLDQPILAPAHQSAEMLSAVARLVRARAISEASAQAALDDAAALRQEIVYPDRALLQRALELDGRIRVLDAVYVAVAERHDCPLLTTDMRLARTHPPCPVIAPGA